jgi:hypothetical protein
MIIRPVLVEDLWSIMRLYQIEGSTLMPDDLFTDYERLMEAFLNPNSYWVMTEEDGQLACLFALLLDHDLGLSKLSRIMIDPAVPHIEEFMGASLRALLDHIREEFSKIELVYTTTFTLPLAFQKLTLKENFRVLGVFPNAQGVDENNLNGLSVAYLRDDALKARDPALRLHESVVPFFQLAQKSACISNLLASTEAPQSRQTEVIYCDMPEMEAIFAPNFVRRRFDILKSNRSQLVNFYPFYYPNCVFTDPTGKVEVFLRVIEKSRFAAIIGEHIRIPVDPTQMFAAVFAMLKKRNINYIELINDAGDVAGTELIIKSGFTPCGYIPAFKKQGHRRRDYAIFGKSFEYSCRPNLSLVPKEYLEYYLAYLRQEQRNFFQGLSVRFDMQTFDDAARV